MKFRCLTQVTLLKTSAEGFMIRMAGWLEHPLNRSPLNAVSTTKDPALLLGMKLARNSIRIANVYTFA